MKLNTLILGIQNKVRGDRVLSGLLASIATGKATSSDIREFTRLVVKLFYISEVTGYRWQHEAVSRSLTRDGLLALATKAKDKGVTIADSLTDTLGNNPMLMGLVKDSVLGQSTILEGVGTGQLLSAEEAGLGFKTWRHLGLGEESRPDHLALDGVTIPKDEFFTLGDGTQVIAPHDWGRGSAKHFMWCSCQILYTNSR